MGWYNSDGLYIKYGVEEAGAGTAGEYRTTGPQQMAEVVISPMTALTSTAVIQDYNTIIPKNARIEKVEVIAQTACTSGGAATLSIGLIRTDTTTAYAATGFVNALALTSIDAAGETTVLVPGSTGAGTLIGTTLANNGYFVANWGTSAYTAGAVRCRVYYIRT